MEERVDLEDLLDFPRAPHSDSAAAAAAFLPARRSTSKSADSTAHHTAYNKLHQFIFVASTLLGAGRCCSLCGVGPLQKHKCTVRRRSPAAAAATSTEHDSTDLACLS